jgi:hypothetical protein
MRKGTLASFIFNIPAPKKCAIYRTGARYKNKVLGVRVIICATDIIPEKIYIDAFRR